MRAKRTAILPLGLAALLALLTAPARAQEPGQASGFAGSDQCAECHEDIAKGLTDSVHGQKGFSMRSDQGCEACHGPGEAHIEGGGDITKIRSFKVLEASDASAACLECHEKGKQMMWRGSTHENRNLACTECHSVHQFKSDKFQLKTAKVEDTCSDCHLQIKAQIQKTSHHPIREGLLSCADCHNVHGTQADALVSANSVNEKCYECHTEKRGPFLWDHPPVRENCLNCHVPHGSSHVKLLATRRPYLCQQCHLDTRHPGTLYDANNLLTSNREFSRSCSNCHLTLHGSNHPSGAFFLR
jgi:DmsE family decaheme c-type cytochrome